MADERERESVCGRERERGGSREREIEILRERERDVEWNVDDRVKCSGWYVRERQNARGKETRGTDKGESIGPGQGVRPNTKPISPLLVILQLLLVLSLLYVHLTCFSSPLRN